MSDDTGVEEWLEDAFCANLKSFGISSVYVDQYKGNFEFHKVILVILVACDIFS